MDFIDLHDAPPIKVLIRDVARKEVAGEENGQEDRLLEEARYEVQDSVRPGLEEAHGIRDAVDKDGSRDAKRDEELHDLVLLLLIAAIDDVGELGPDVGEGQRGVHDEQECHSADASILRLQVEVHSSCEGWSRYVKHGIEIFIVLVGSTRV